MANGTIQALYEMAKSNSQLDPVTGIPKFDEQKFRRALESNRKLGKRNKDIFEDGEPKSKTCPRYDPCPICDKCRAKASHLYKSCETCKIPICSHTYADREKMIKRKNFVITVEPEVMEEIKELDSKVYEMHINTLLEKDKESLANKVLQRTIDMLTDTTEIEMLQKGECICLVQKN